uniref:LysM domain-containing protein n=1 Tax=Anopheles braziliensis TaxID=58242 RepID=A0A2M3Z7E8_9DIPT
MEDETMFGEKQSIRESARSLKKYGSISGGSRSPATAALSTDALIRHEVERTDTLQGLALKYGCSMEQIRRINRLLPTDTIFLRPFLMVPVAKDSPHYPKDPDAIIRPNTLAARAATMVAPPGGGGGAGASGSTNSIVSNHNNNNNNHHHHHHHHTASSSISSSDDNGYEGSPLVVSPEEESRKNLEEFLGKIDSSIATTRKCIAEVQRNSDFVSSSQSDDNLFISSSSGAASGSGSSGYYSKPRAYSNASSSSSISSYQQYHYHLPSSSSGATGATTNHHHKRQSSSGSAASDTSQLIVMTQGKRVQSSLQKLERQQDELFEL